MGDSIVLKFEKARCALDNGPRQFEDIVPQAIGCQAASRLGVTSLRAALREIRVLKKLIERARVEEDKPTDVCIVGLAPATVAGFHGTLSSILATKLGSIAIESALKKVNVDPSLVPEVDFPNVLSANLGHISARQAALCAGIPNTVHKVFSWV